MCVDGELVTIAITLLGTNGPVEEIEWKRRGMKIFYNKKISKNNNIAAGFLVSTALVYLVYGKYTIQSIVCEA